MRVRVLVGAALALVLAAVAVLLSESKDRLAATNNLRAVGFVVTLPAGASACQEPEFVPGDGTRVRLLVGTYERPVPPLEFEIRPRAGRPLRGDLRGGGREGNVEVPLERTTTPISDARVCVRNGGHRRIVIAGFPTKRPLAALVRGRRARGKMRFEYMRPGRESWWALAPTVAHRFGIGKAGFMGDWTLAAAAILLLVAWIAAVGLLVRPRLQ